MTYHVAKAGVGQKGWMRLIQNLHGRPFAKVQTIHAFLEHIYINEWQAIHTTWTLPNATPEMWENMELMFEEMDFHDYTRLKNDHAAMRAAWKQFKEDLKKMGHEHEPETEAEGERSGT